VYFGRAIGLSESGIKIGVKYFMANKNATHSHPHSDSDAVFYIWIWVSHCYCLTARQILHIFVWPALYCCFCMSIFLLMSHVVTVVRCSVCIWMPTVPHHLQPFRFRKTQTLATDNTHTHTHTHTRTHTRCFNRIPVLITYNHSDFEKHKHWPHIHTHTYTHLGAHTWETPTPSHELRGRAAQWASIVI